MSEEEAQKLVEEHVSWFLEIIKPLLIAFMLHGIKHEKAKKRKRKGTG